MKHIKILLLIVMLICVAWNGQADTQWVLTYKSSLSGGLIDGSSLTMTNATGDTVSLQNFWSRGAGARAVVKDGTISIPAQQIGQGVYLAAQSGNGDGLVGTMLADTLFSITTPWRVYTADSTIVTCDSTVLERANGTMHANYHGTTGANDWDVVIAQTAKNVITVKNMGGHGATAEVVLGSDGTVTVPQQRLWAGGSNGNFYCRAVDWTTGDVSYPIKGTVTTQKISWGGWMMLSTLKTYYGFDDATITGVSFSLPTASESWEGEGTLENPYKIKTVEDLLLLANRVNSDTARTYGTSPNVYTKSFKGSYFSLESDLDLRGLRFEPIGNAFAQRFDGTLLGNGHTISNLNVSTGEAGYAGFIGAADREALVLGINFVNPTITTSGNYAGTFGMFYGLIDSVAVTGGNVSNTGGVATGGIVAVGENVNACSFQGTVNGSGGLMAGGIAGALYGTTSGSHAVATITSAQQATGGVAGYLYEQNAKIDGCYYNGAITSTQHTNANLGGLAGQVYGGTVTKSFATATLTGIDRESNTGGLVGQLIGTLSDSYATGYVNNPSSKSTGGLVGQIGNSHANGDTVQSLVSGCYFAGRLNANVYQYDAASDCRELYGTITDGSLPKVTSCYFDKQLSTLTTQHNGLTTGQLTAAEGPIGFNPDAWLFTQGYYPRLRSIATDDAVCLSASVVALNDAFPDNVGYVSESAKLNLLGEVQASLLMNGTLGTEGHCGTLKEGMYLLNQQAGTDTLVLSVPSAAQLQPRTYVLTVSPKYFAGSGTQADPFQITTKNDILRLGQLTSELYQTFNGVYFRQMSDIDMENDSTFVGLSAHEIDNSLCKFAGIYDGGGHTIHNLWINSVDWKVAPTDSTLGTPQTMTHRTQVYKGFIGTLDEGGVLKNLTLASDCHADVWAYAGALVGNNYGLVDSCVSYASVKGYSSYIGGLVGRNNSSGTISNCLNAGHVQGGAGFVGGIVATTSGRVTACMNVGTVEACVLSTFCTASKSLAKVGGIAATASGAVFSQVVNAGHVAAPGGTAAGLFAVYSSSSHGTSYAGSNDTDQALNYGTVFSGNASATGAIGADGVPPNATLGAIAYDYQATGLQAVAGDKVSGMKAIATSELTDGQALAGFPQSAWNYASGQYPVLSQFASLPVVKAARSVWVRPAAEQTIRNLTDDVALGSASWTLLHGGSFAVSDGVLRVPSAEATDTLLAVNGDFSTAYAVRVVASVPLQGAGTEANPYQLSDTADWNALATYIATYENPLQGCYVKVMNDIDFSGTEFIPIGYDCATPFAGTMLGDGHKISGISYKATATYQGAFCWLAASSLVNGLTLQGEITSSFAHTGGFAGKLAGRLTDCVNAINVTGTATSLAGFAALAEAGAAFERCTNEGNVNGSQKWVAGFVADCPDEITFTDCVNNGNITNSRASNHTAGFVTDGATNTFVSCVNNGDVTSLGGYVAGLQSYANGDSTITFADCSNNGAISAATNAAGLLGGIASSTTLGRPNVRAVRSANYGTVTMTGSSSTNGTAGLFAAITPGTMLVDCSNHGAVTAEKGANVGGIWGRNINGTAKDSAIVVRRCHNTGNINAVRFVGGIGGCITAYTAIDSCYNTGAITAEQGVAGMGNVQGAGSAITYCWNAGSITATTGVAGGLVGYGNYGHELNYCFNVGSVTTEGDDSYCAGGLTAQGYSVITYSYNAGDVKGADRVGGLVGQTNNSSFYCTQLTDCYNAGRVTGQTKVGNVVGTYGTTNWNEANGNKAENVIALNDWGVQASDTSLCKLMSVKELCAANVFDTNVWLQGDSYTMPILKGVNVAAARANAASVVLTGTGDTYDKVTTNVKLGLPDSVVWMCINADLVLIEGENGWTVKPSTDSVTLTASCGDFSRAWPLQLNVTSGINDVLTDKAVVCRLWFTVQGVALPKEPETHDGQVYIVVTTYDDGTMRATKLVR